MTTCRYYGNMHFSSYLETCYWHLIEKRFCYDEEIALYEVPEKGEKNNNVFDNMAFYDSVSVIAGRAVVTIDPLPPEEKPIVKQPTKRLRWEEELKNEINKQHISRSVPTIYHEDDNKPGDNRDAEEAPKIVTEVDKKNPTPNQENVTSNNGTKTNETTSKYKMETLKIEYLDPETKRKSLRERRMSKSLYLKIEQPKELPLIRQQSMPKFYLDTPDVHQTTASVLRSPSTVLMSPVPVPSSSSGFIYDLYSVVQIEKEKEQIKSQSREKDLDKLSRLTQIKERIKIKRGKSSSGFPTNLPHSHQHI